MTRRSTLIGLTTLATLSAGIAQAQAVAITGEVTRNKIEAAYAAFEFIDIRYGLTQVKVEAVDNDTNRKVETVYDRATGRVIATEMEAAGDDAGRSGIVVRSDTRDFEDEGRDDLTSADDTTSTDDDDGRDDSTSSDDDNGRDDSTSSDDRTSGDDSTRGDDGPSGDDDSSGGDDD
ncbi:MAG: hypothetical protein RIR62_2244 [Pseudomonadota bacterium]